MATTVVQTYSRAVLATTNVDFTFGPADGVLLLVVPSAITLTLVGGGTLVMADTSGMRSGEFLPIRCTKAVFPDGSLAALAVN